MKGGQTTLHRRINITLPEETAKLIARVAPKGNRSRLIAEAIRYYIEGVGRANLRQQLRTGALRRARRDLKLAQDWFTVDEEAWQRAGK